MDDPAIRTEKLSRSFGELVALEGLDLDVPRGALFALLGPNGAGKSTTIKILTTLLAPSGGRGLVAGFDCAVEQQAVGVRAVNQALHQARETFVIANAWDAGSAAVSRTAARWSAALAFEVDSGARRRSRPARLRRPCPTSFVNGP